MKRTHAFLMTVALLIALAGGLFILWNSHTQASHEPTFVLPTSSLAASQYFVQGVEHYHKQQYEEAAVQLQRAIAADSSFELAYRRLVEVRKAQKNWQPAIAYFTDLTLKHPQNSYPHFGLGLLFAATGEHAEAISSDKKAIALSPHSASIYAAFARAHRQEERIDEAIAWLDSVANSSPTPALARYGQAFAYYIRHDWDNAMIKIEQATALDSTLLAAPQLKVTILRNTGSHDEALQIAGIVNEQASNAPELRCSALLDIGDTHRLFGDHEKSVAALEQALATARAIGDKTRESMALNRLALVYQSKGDFDNALSYFERSLVLYESLGDQQGIAIALGNIGDVHVFREEFAKALPCLNQALQISVKLGDTRSEARNLGTLSAVYSLLGDFPVAFDYQHRAIGIYRQIDYRSGEATELANLGAIYVEQGKYAEALQATSQAVAIAKELGEQEYEQVYLGNLGTIHLLLGDFDKAERHFEAALTIAHKVENTDNEGAWLGSLSEVFLARGDTSKAVQYLERSLVLFSKGEAKRDAAICYANLGKISMARAQYDRAAEYFEMARQLNTQIDNRYGLAMTYNDLGALQLERGELDRAQQNFSNAENIGDELQSASILWMAHHGIGRIHQHQGELPQALQRYQRALHVVENMRSELLSADHKSGFLTDKAELYHDLIEVCLALTEQRSDREGKALAFHYAERFKARALLDILTEAKVNANVTLNSDMVARQRAVFRSISKIQTELRIQPPTLEGRQSLIEQLEAAEHKLERLQLVLKQENPAYADLFYPESATAGQVQREVLNAGEVLLEYVLGENSSFLFAISKSDYHVFKLPPESEIAESAQAYLKTLQQQPALVKVDFAAGARLYELLIGPAESTIPTEASLIIIPDGLLHYLPFEALVKTPGTRNSQFLIERFCVSYAPSASVLAFIRTRRRAAQSQQPSRLLVFADPVFGRSHYADVTRGLHDGRGFEFARLPYTALEAQRIAARYPNGSAQVYLRERATEEQVKAIGSERYAAVHFATHAAIDEQRPLRSGIVLTLDDDPTEDGLLQMNEIFNLQLNAELVVLSACETGKGKMLRGEGIIGLARAFFYAGANSMLVSLWPVLDYPTADFMETFYANLQRGMDKTVALRQTKLESIRDEEGNLQPPHYWAPFILLGNSK